MRLVIELLSAQTLSPPPPSSYGYCFSMIAIKLGRQFQKFFIILSKYVRTLIRNTNYISKGNTIVQ